VNTIELVDELVVTEEAVVCTVTDDVALLCVVSVDMVIV
jgi:hypothetical protein